MIKMKKNGPYTILSSEQVYKNPWLNIQEDKVLHPDGSEGIFTTVDNGSGVSIVALDDKHNIHLIREYYYVLQEYGLQTPSGGIESGETPLEGAKKELLEETGLIASEWTELGYVDALTMIIKSPSYLFLASGLEKQQEPEPGIEVVTMPFAEVYQMVLDSEITHGPSCVAILKAKEKIEGS